MTEDTTDQDLTENQLLNLILKFTSIIIMGVLLWASINLLSWAVHTKLSSSETMVTNQITAEFREHQLGCLSKNIYHEAGSEPFEGKVAVAQVTLNRTKSGQFPGDICRTIYQKTVVYDKLICQFSWVCDREVTFRPTNPENYKESVDVAKRVLLEGFTLPGLKNAMYFHGDYINPAGWEQHKKVAHIGHHIFYE
jgi:spore germination cell wall hydrolase CwlJ-like protein